jgi:asparagine synthase (glutamine-hydrolysing)
MCAINGYISLGKNLVTQDFLQQKIKGMQLITKHRGPDESTQVVMDAATLGMSRLAIVSPKPLVNLVFNQGSKYLVCNGEIVNNVKLKETYLGGQDNLSDSSVLLSLIQEEKEHSMEKLAGMYAIAVLDTEQQLLTLWRDPLGVKPLYYYHDEKCFIFSSEAKAVLSVIPHSADINVSAIKDIISYRFHPGQTTVFPICKRVLPGETIAIDIRTGQMDKVQAIALNNSQPAQAPKNFDRDQSIITFRKLLQSVIAEHAQADARGGFFISGGLDSSLVASIALQQKSAYQTPISLRFEPHGVIDEKYVEVMERYLKKKIEWVTITDQEARDTLEEVVPYLDEPLENPIHIGTYLMAKRAQQLGIKSVLTGDGSDEFFIGYERHKCWFSPDKTYQGKTYWQWLETLPPEEVEPLFGLELMKTFLPMQATPDQPIEAINSLQQALWFERRERLPEYHCMRLDRMTMAHGVEAKVPFLDQRITRFAEQLPLNVLYGQSGKGWLQEVAKPFLPIEILQRPKVHFPSLPDQWLSGKGVSWAADILLDHRAQTRNVFQRATLKRYLKEHRDGTRKWGRVLWACVTTELWLNNTWINNNKKG